MKVIPVINKIDLPQSDPEQVKKEIEEIIGIDASEALSVSAKDGTGLEELLQQIVEEIPEPNVLNEENLQALIIDSWYDNYLGVVSLIRIFSGKVNKETNLLLNLPGKPLLLKVLVNLHQKRKQPIICQRERLVF